MKGLWSEHFPGGGEKTPESAPFAASPSGKMEGLWSEHFPAAGEKTPDSKPLGASPSPKINGLWTDNCAAVEKTPERAPLGRSERCLICCSCNAACRPLESTTVRNPGRMFYSCPSRVHKFFKWADEVKPEELIDVPYCGGCNAGVCRVRREKTGDNAGRILFMCTIKEGHGSCGYRVWKDELERPAIIQENERIASLEETTVKCNGTDSTNTDLAEGSKQIGDGADGESTGADSSQHIQCLDVTSRKTDHSKCREDKSSYYSKRPSKRSRRGDLKAPSSIVSTRPLKLVWAKDCVPRHCWWSAAIGQDLSSHFRGWWHPIAFHPMPFLIPHASKPFTIYASSPLDSTFVMQDKFLVSCDDPISPSRSLLEVESHSQSLIPGENAGFSGTKILDVSLDEQSCSYTLSDTIIDTVMSKSISTAFDHAAGILRNDLLSLLETMDIKDHEAMAQEAEATFAALDQLLIDHQDFKKRVKGFIHCAVSLAEIEESMRNDSYQELVDHCSSAKMRLDKIKCGHDEVVEAFSSSKKCLKGVQEEVASALEFIFQIQAELSCCEVELEDMEQQMEMVKKGKELLEGNYVLKCKQLEECEKLRDVKAAEYNVAKAAFNRERMMLRG